MAEQCLAVGLRGDQQRRADAALTEALQQLARLRRRTTEVHGVRRGCADRLGDCVDVVVVQRLWPSQPTRAGLSALVTACARPEPCGVPSSATQTVR